MSWSSAFLTGHEFPFHHVRNPRRHDLSKIACIPVETASPGGEVNEYRGRAWCQSMNSFSVHPESFCEAAGFVSHQGRLRVNVISEFAFMRAFCIARRLFPAAWSYVKGLFCIQCLWPVVVREFLDNLDSNRKGGLALLRNRTRSA
jgi:hypothetical protein